LLADRLRNEQVFRQSVMDRPHPIGIGNRPPLGIGDRNNGNRREGLEDRLMLQQVEAAMERVTNGVACREKIEKG